MSPEGERPLEADDGLPPDRAAGVGSADLDQRLAGALERMGHVTRTMLSRGSYEEGVSPLQLQLLQRLGSARSGPRVSDLAVELDVSQATISDALATMRRKELVTRSQDPVDRRNSVFSLTDHGEAVRQRLAEWDRPLTAKLSRLGDDEKGTALRVVLGLVAELHADGVVNVARTCLTCRFFDHVTHPDDADPYHCTLLDLPFADTGLRVDCAEHEPAEKA